jgi:ribosomal protein S18 acetylase RimI-like enzyme
MPNQIHFDGEDDGVWFQYYPPRSHIVKHDKKDRIINLCALFLYVMYRSILFDAYNSNPNLADDISSHEKQYVESETSELSQASIYLNPVHHYAVAASLNAMNTWLEPYEKMQCYFAYESLQGRKRIVGFVHFQEKTVNENKIVYIAQAGVISSKQRMAVGRRLMQCVLAHYDTGTHFKILTRVFNTAAIRLYGERLLFSPINKEDVKKLGYDGDKYCGFEFTTTREYLDKIISNIKGIDEEDCMSGLKATMQL